MTEICKWPQLWRCLMLWQVPPLKVAARHGRDSEAAASPEQLVLTTQDSRGSMVVHKGGGGGYLLFPGGRFCYRGMARVTCDSPGALCACLLDADLLNANLIPSPSQFPHLAPSKGAACSNSRPQTPLPSKLFSTPVVYVQNNQHVMGITLRYVCWGTQRPPPPSPGTPAADRPTHLTPHPPLPPSRPPEVFAPGWGLEFEQAAPPRAPF